MTPQEKAKLKTHLNPIAKIFYKDSYPAGIQTLEGVEVTARQKIQRHVSPELGSFYPRDYPNTIRQAKKAQKYPWRIGYNPSAGR
jgi:hypothetical protein